MSSITKPAENITIPAEIRREADELRADLDRFADITTPEERTYRIALAMESARTRGRIEVRQEHLAETVARVRRLEEENHTDDGAVIHHIGGGGAGAGCDPNNTDGHGLPLSVPSGASKVCIAVSTTEPAVAVSAVLIGNENFNRPMTDEEVRP
jgi:hypothetical protein